MRISRNSNPKTRSFSTADGLRLVADETGDPDAQPVVLLHGLGQTRFSWKALLPILAEAGFHAVSLDARGHGESDWDPAADYSLSALADDLRRVIAELPLPPVIVGASLGGITGLLAEGENSAPLAHSLVLVDVTPRIKLTGVERIKAFMADNLSGFDSVEAVAVAVAKFNPHRPRSESLSGLRRNLREQDGRFYWHWDPAFLVARDLDFESSGERIEAAARKITIPTRLIRGGKSDLVGEAEVAHFRQLLPALDYVDVAGAGHMVAGDQNDAFNAAIMEFVQHASAGPP